MTVVCAYVPNSCSDSPALGRVAGEPKLLTSEPFYIKMEIIFCG